LQYNYEIQTQRNFGLSKKIEFAFESDLSDEQILEKLLALNLEMCNLTHKMAGAGSIKWPHCSLF